MKRDFTPWLLLPCIVLTLSSVTLLARPEAAHAAPPAPQAAAPNAPASDDDEGDELLEHWGDPQYAREERCQLGGIAAGFLVLGAATAGLRTRRRTRGLAAPLPTESEFVTLDTPTDTRKAA